MCQAKPGPRCSTHAKATLERAKEHSAKMLRHAQLDQSEDNIRKFSLAEEQRRQAQVVYDTTPQGQKILQERIAILRSEKNDDNARQLSTYLQHRKTEREAQLKAARLVKYHQIKNDLSLSAHVRQMAHLRHFLQDVDSEIDSTAEYGLIVDDENGESFNTEFLSSHLRAYGIKAVAPAQEISVQQIKYTHQEDVYPAVIMNYVKPGSVQLDPPDHDDEPWVDKSLPLLVQLRDESYYVLDGNHRVCAAKVKNDMTIKAYIIHIDNMPKHPPRGEDEIVKTIPQRYRNLLQGDQNVSA